MNGVLRPVDELGRVVIPKEMRKFLGIKDGVTKLEVIVMDEGILLKSQSTRSNKPLSVAVDVINRELKISRNLDPKVLLGMNRIKNLIENELKGGNEDEQKTN